MKKTIVYLSLLLTTISCMNAQKSFTKIALDENLLSLDGNQIPFKEILKKHQGKTIIIECWASWCGDCVKAMPKIKELQTNNPEVDYVFISMDKTVENWKIGVEKHNLIGDHYMANDQMKGVFGKSIDLDWIPRYIIVDKKGEIVLYRAIETDFEKINTSLKSLK